MSKFRIWALILIILGGLAGYFSYQSETGAAFKNYPFRFGLDLSGGIHLVYQADTSRLSSADIDDAMESLRETIERRVNIFGVSEPLVQVEKASVSGQTVNKLIVELPGFTDIGAATQSIGQTPLLEFRLIEEMPVAPGSTTTQSVAVETGLTGRLVKRADVVFDQTTAKPMVSLSFNDEGKKLFADITRANVGKVLGIFLDGAPISTPVIREEISDGQAQISGDFTPDEAKKLVRDLNYGALPVPVSLVGTQSIGASLGTNALKASVNAGIWSFIIIAAFLIIWYRLPGVVAVAALAIYVAINLVIFKLIPVTLTSAGLAGFILSIGMAVDANILIFERLKEELRRGLPIKEAMTEGFARAWLSIRDSNLSSIITAFILFYFATSSLIKGFALVFAIGVIVSMFTAITVTRTFLLALGFEKTGRLTKFLFSSGINVKS